MAKATKTTTNKTTAAKANAGKTATKANEATTEQVGKIGDNTAATVANNAAAKTGGPAAKADAVLAAKQQKRLAIEGKGEPEERFVILEGHSIWKGGVRYIAGDYIDLPKVDSERMLGVQIREYDPELDDADDSDDDDQGAGVADDATLTGENGQTVPHPDTPAGAELQKAQEEEAARKEAENLANGLPSGADNK